MPILANNHLFKIVAFGAEKTRTHTLKSRCTQNECFVRIFVQRHNWVIFLRQCARRSRCSQWRSLSGHVEQIFCSQKSQRRILATFGFNRTALRATQPKLNWCFAPCFWRSHYQQQSWCHLAYLFDYYLWGAGRDNCLFKGQYSWSHLYFCTQSIMCCKIGPFV